PSVEGRSALPWGECHAPPVRADRSGDDPAARLGHSAPGRWNEGGAVAAAAAVLRMILIMEIGLRCLAGARVQSELRKRRAGKSGDSAAQDAPAAGRFEVWFVHRPTRGMLCNP